MEELKKIKQHKVTLQEIADLLGITKRTLIYKRKGVTQWKLNEITKLKTNYGNEFAWQIIRGDKL